MRSSRAAIGVQEPVEKSISDKVSESRIVGDALVQIEIGIHDLLDDLLDLVIEGSIARFHVYSHVPRRRARRRP